MFTQVVQRNIGSFRARNLREQFPAAAVLLAIVRVLVPMTEIAGVWITTPAIIRAGFLMLDHLFYHIQHPLIVFNRQKVIMRDTVCVDVSIILILRFLFNY